MATRQSINDTEKTRKAGVAFGTIAELADTMHELCIEAIAQADNPNGSSGAMMVAIREMCGLVGFIADQHSKELGGGSLKNADPAQWLQPPIYQEIGGSQHG